MCVAIPGQVVARHPVQTDLVIVDLMGFHRTIDIGFLTEPPAPGDWVLCLNGFALSSIDELDALSALDRVRHPEECYYQTGYIPPAIG